MPGQPTPRRVPMPNFPGPRLPNNLPRGNQMPGGPPPPPGLIDLVTGREDAYVPPRLPGSLPPEQQLLPLEPGSLPQPRIPIPSAPAPPNIQLDPSIGAPSPPPSLLSQVQQLGPIERELPPSTLEGMTANVRNYPARYRYEYPPERGQSQDDKLGEILEGIKAWRRHMDRQPEIERVRREGGVEGLSSADIERIVRQSQGPYGPGR